MTDPEPDGRGLHSYLANEVDTRRPVSGAISEIILVNALQPQTTRNTPEQVRFTIHFGEGKPSLENLGVSQ